MFNNISKKRQYIVSRSLYNCGNSKTWVYTKSYWTLCAFDDFFPGRFLLMPTVVKTADTYHTGPRSSFILASVWNFSNKMSSTQPLELDFQWFQWISRLSPLRWRFQTATTRSYHNSKVILWHLVSLFHSLYTKNSHNID